MAGPEIAVATTKAYSTQLVATYALAIQFAKVRGEISEERYVELIKEIKILPRKNCKDFRRQRTYPMVCVKTGKCP